MSRTNKENMEQNKKHENKQQLPIWFLLSFFILNASRIPAGLFRAQGPGPRVQKPLAYIFICISLSIFFFVFLMFLFFVFIFFLPARLVQWDLPLGPSPRRPWISCLISTARTRKKILLIIIMRIQR